MGRLKCPENCGSRLRREADIRSEKGEKGQKNEYIEFAEEKKSGGIGLKKNGERSLGNQRWCGTKPFFTKEAL